MQTISTPVRVFAILTIVTTLISMFLRYQGSSIAGTISLISTIFAVCTLGAFIYERVVKKA